MDPHIDAARTVMRRHQPGRLWACLGLNRCKQGCGKWPCNSWRNARDIRDRVLDGPAIARMLTLVNERYRRMDSDAHR